MLHFLAPPPCKGKSGPASSRCTNPGEACASLTGDGGGVGGMGKRSGDRRRGERGKFLVCEINDKCYLNKEDIKIIKVEKESFVTT